MRRPTVRHFLFSFLLILVCLSFKAQANSPEKNKIVVAHWHIPMKYEANETWQEQIQNDIRAAIELGIEGFALNAFTGKQAKGILSTFIKEADAIGAHDFKVFLSADMSLGFTAEDIVDTIETHGKNSHYLTINGKPLLSTYGGDKLGNEWWQTNVLIPLKELGKEVTFIPYFDRPNPNGDKPSYENWIKVINNFTSVDGLFNFLMPGSTPFYTTDTNIGHHWWSILEAEENLSKALKDSNKIFMAPFMPYYWATCHSARQYMEHQGGRGMHNYWTSIIEKQKPEIVEIVTWNDYSESSYIQPTRVTLEKTKGIKSQPHLGYYELLKYYVSWYKTGQKPKIIRDGLFFFHRLHPNNAIPSNDQAICSKGPVQEHQKWGLIKDVIYVTTALTEPAEIKVSFGGNTQTFSAPAGLNTIDVPFQAGTPVLSLVRNGKVRATINGGMITEKPDHYNYNVYSGYAIANGQTSETWMPSDAWKAGYTADWFVSAQGQ